MTPTNGLPQRRAEHADRLRRLADWLCADADDDSDDCDFDTIREDIESNRWAHPLFILWALPAGAQDRIEEQPLTSFPITKGEANRVRRHAMRDGWHSFRVVPEDGEVPDFASTLNRKLEVNRGDE